MGCRGHDEAFNGGGLFPFFYLTTSNGGAPFCLMTTPNDSNNTDGFWQHLNLTNWLWRTEDAVSGEFGGNAEAPTGFVSSTYYHLTVVVTTNSIKFYRNGLLIGTMQTVLPSSGTVSGGGYQYYKIGTMTDNSNPMTADLGELKVYKTQKTLNEIFDLAIKNHQNNSAYLITNGHYIIAGITGLVSLVTFFKLINTFWT